MIKVKETILITKNSDTIENYSVEQEIDCTFEEYKKILFKNYEDKYIIDSLIEDENNFSFEFIANHLNIEKAIYKIDSVLI